MYARIKLADRSVIEAPVALPPELVGLDNTSLADLPAALKPVPAAFKGVGFWPVIVQAPPLDPVTQRPGEGYDLSVDADARAVTATGRVEARPAAEVAAAMAALRAAALATSMAYGNSITERVFGAYSRAEIASWDKQAAEAHRVKAGETLPPGSLLPMLAAAKGISLDAFADRVIAKEAGFTAILAAAYTLRQEAEARLLDPALDTPAKLDAAVAQLRAEADALAAKLIG